ncbi:hypothetical protein, partial [Fusobacterium sp. PH5-44]|uniref:hypothetical protein n=1 Tax=unclassified Fusobacterium TaxID=2648384 RepID=UPI003D20380D
GLVGIAGIYGGVKIYRTPTVGVGQILENKNITKINGLDDILHQPDLLKGVKPSELYKLLINKGYKVEPLSQGSLKGLDFSKGGGFKVLWGKDRLLQYHPPGKTHGYIDYYKISSGKTGTVRFDLNGKTIK